MPHSSIIGAPATTGDHLTAPGNSFKLFGMSPNSRIIVVGSINTDLVIRGPRLPAPERPSWGVSYYQAAGGKGAESAVAAARAAIEPVLFVAAVGDDDCLGHAALQRFRSENLVCDYLKTIPGASSGVALILVDESGQNLMSVAAGANAHLSAEDLEAIPDDLFSTARVFLTCLETPLPPVAAGLQHADAPG